MATQLMKYEALRQVARLRYPGSVPYAVSSIALLFIMEQNAQGSRAGAIPTASATTFFGMITRMLERTLNISGQDAQAIHPLAPFSLSTSHLRTALVILGNRAQVSTEPVDGRADQRIIGIALSVIE